MTNDTTDFRIIQGMPVNVLWSIGLLSDDLTDNQQLKSTHYYRGSHNIKFEINEDVSSADNKDNNLAIIYKKDTEILLVDGYYLKFSLIDENTIQFWL